MSLGPVLQFADEQGRSREHVLDAAERVTIGRSPPATIPLLTDSSVSRLHALIEWVDTEWTVVDDGLSRNGGPVVESTDRRRTVHQRPVHQRRNGENTSVRAVYQVRS